MCCQPQNAHQRTAVAVVHTVWHAERPERIDFVMKAVRALAAQYAPFVIVRDETAFAPIAFDAPALRLAHDANYLQRMRGRVPLDDTPLHCTWRSQSQSFSSLQSQPSIVVVSDESAPTTRANSLSAPTTIDNAATNDAPSSSSTTTTATTVVQFVAPLLPTSARSSSVSRALLQQTNAGGVGIARTPSVVVALPLADAVPPPTSAATPTVDPLLQTGMSAR